MDIAQDTPRNGVVGSREGGDGRGQRAFSQGGGGLVHWVAVLPVID